MTYVAINVTLDVGNCKTGILVSPVKGFSLDDHAKTRGTFPLPASVV